MSYINEALKKAQKDKDTRYVSYRGMLESVGKDRRIIKSKKVWGSLLFLVIIVIVFMGYLWLDSGGEETQVKIEKEPPTGRVKGLVDSKEGNIPQKKTIEKIEAEKPEAVNVVVSDPKAFYDRAGKIFREGRIQEAEKLYRNALALNPEYVEALNNLGVIYIHRRDYAKARSSFEKAIQLKPSYVEPYYNLACLYSIKGELTQGLTQLKKAISLDQTVKDWALKDSDLRNLKGLPEFDEILKENRSLPN